MLAFSLWGGSTAAEPEFGDVQLVDIDLGSDEFGNVEMLFSGGMSANGRYAVVTNGGGTYWHVDLSNNALTLLELVDATPTDDGQYVLGTDRNGGGERLREEVGTLDPQPYPFETIDIGLDPTSWYPALVIDATTNGRYALLSATTTDNFLTRHFVYDNVAGELVTPTTGLPAAETNVLVDRLDRAGSTLSYRSYCCAGANWASFERLDFVTGERTTLTMPSEHNPFLRNWTASPNHEWLLFSSSDADVIDGLDATERIYRRNVATGVTDVVPIDFNSIQGVTAIDVFDGGNVIYALEFPTTGDVDTDQAVQLFSWAGGAGGAGGAAEADLLSVGVDGQPARPSGVMGIGWTADGSRVMFTSFATNLVAGVTLPDDLADLVRRLYLVDLNVESEQDPAIQGAVGASAPAVRCGVSC